MLKPAFEKNHVASCLDILDSSINGGGKQLTDRIKEKMNICTDIIVVLSEATKESWWVSFEIGMSAQVDIPTASYLKSDVTLASYLAIGLA